MKLSTAITNGEVKVPKVAATKAVPTTTEKELVAIKKLLQQILKELKKT
jgi:hypothetical protein|tara:strand:- start:738 stop:884 length:147 start_codon:yes stop_codon:yes gene_type:complete